MDDLKKQIRNEFNDKIRNEYINQYPFCQYCGEKAEHVHHIIPIVNGGDNREGNLISLCSKCHGLIHNKNFNQDWKTLQKIGIEKAKAEGKFKGRTKKKLNSKTYLDLKSKYMAKQINKGEFAKLLDVSRPTLDRILMNEEAYLNYWNNNIDIN